MNEIQYQACIEALNDSSNSFFNLNSNPPTNNNITLDGCALSSVNERPAQLCSDSSETSVTSVLSKSTPVDEYVNALKDLKLKLRNRKQPKTNRRNRKNRPLKEFFKKTTVINFVGREVPLHSLNFNSLQTLLIEKRAFLPPPPQIPGINHLHVVQTLQSPLLHHFKSSVIGEFPYRLAAYFLSENAFYKCFFPQLSNFHGRSIPRKRKEILKPEYAKLLQYYALYFGGALFDHDRRLQNAWIEGVRTAMNAAVDRIYHFKNENRPFRYFSYFGHIPPLTEENAFE